MRQGECLCVLGDYDIGGRRWQRCVAGTAGTSPASSRCLGRRFDGSYMASPAAQRIPRNSQRSRPPPGDPATLALLGRAAAAQGRLVYLEDRPQATPQSAPLPSQSGCLSSRKHPTCAQLPGTGIGCSRCISAGRSPVSARHSFSSARVARPHCVPRVGAPTSPPACCVCRTGRTMFHGSLALVPASTSDAIVSPTGIMPSHSLQQPDHGLSAGLVCPVVAGTALQGTQSMLSIILLPCTSSRFVSWSRAAETIH